MALSVLVAGGVGVGDSFCFGGCKIRVLGQVGGQK